MEQLKHIWFYLGPYVFISGDKDGYLFYNTLKQKGIEFRRNNAIDPIVGHLQQIENMYSVSIPVDELEDSRLYEFVQSLQEEGYGDILEGNLPKPFLMPPFLSLQKSVERMQKNELPIGEHILSNLQDVTIYLNGTCRHDCLDCGEMFKQWPCCTKKESSLDFNSLKEFLYSIAYTRASVNITGGNLFEYPGLYELLEILGRNVSIQTFIVNYRNVPDQLDSLYVFTNDSFRLKIVVCDSYPMDSLVAMAVKLKQEAIHQLWEIGVTSVDEYDNAELLSEQLTRQEIPVAIKPYFNGKNLAFFEEYIFVRQEDLLVEELDRQEVFALQELNTNDFGKITVLSDGKIYANVNREPIGTISESIGTVLCRELESGTSWRFTRYCVEPCIQCRFRLVCPSPSNYELAMNRPNLCHVKTAKG